jgi:glucokinase
MKEKLYIGVDFGGTKILTGAINIKGEVISKTINLPTIGTDDAGTIFKKVTDSIEQIIMNKSLNNYEIAGIGLGVTGPIDITNGIILECPQLPTMHFFPLKQRVEDYFSLPVFMNNDANCMIYGEAIYGSGAGMNIVVGFTLGTGIGCAIVIDKKIFNGSTDSAAEIWPSPYLDGAIEDYTSGAGVSKIYKKYSGNDKSSIEVSLLAEKEDADALKTWDEFGMHLAVALSWSINLIDPDIVILGGSISNAFKLFSPSMEKYLRKHICPVPAEKTRVVIARLGANAGLIGAAALVVR